MRAISRFSVNYPVTVLMIVLGIILLGGISLTRLGTDLFPDLQNPRIYAEVVSGERSPEEIEKRFVEQVEYTICREWRTRGIQLILSFKQLFVILYLPLIRFFNN